MRTSTWLPLCCGLLLLPAASAAQRPLSKAQTKSVVSTSLDACGEIMATTSKIPKTSKKAVTKDRVTKTLHGIWRGRVTGQYPAQLETADGSLNVDYYWIIDMKRGEALVLERLTPQRTVPRPARQGRPTFSFLMCGREGYLPRHPPQVHTFEKISSSVQGAAGILRNSTGVRMATADPSGEISLTSAWGEMLGAKYFERAGLQAFAGALMKPFVIGSVPTADGPPLVSMKYSAEYRGGGMTAARFEPGVPIRGQEAGAFVATSTASGDFLVASMTDGEAMMKETTENGVIAMTFDKVVIGPLEN
jgi:hypothetical protein